MKGEYIMATCYICNNKLKYFSVFNPKNTDKKRSKEELKEISKKYRHYCSEICMDNDPDKKGLCAASYG